MLISVKSKLGRIANNKMIELRKFAPNDIPRLIKWIIDARFLLQWAGPLYKYPLDISQLMATFEKTRGENPPHFMFKAIHTQDQVIVGHVELMDVDYENRTAVLGRVLI